MENEKTKQVPLLLTDDRVIFPGESTYLDATNRLQVNVVDHFLRNQDRKLYMIGVIPVKEIEGPENKVGTLSIVLQVASTNFPTNKSMFHLLGCQRIQVEEMISQEPFPKARVRLLVSSVDMENKENIATVELFRKAISKHFGGVHPLLMKFKNLYDISSIDGLIADSVAVSLLSSFEDQINFLNTLDTVERLKKITSLVTLMESHKVISDNKLKGLRLVRLRPYPDAQVDNEEIDDISDLQERIKKAKLPDYANKVAQRELKRLRTMGNSNAECAATRNYLELLAELPWSVSSKDTVDINKAKEVLNMDHYGMSKVKQRILEYLAVKQLRNKLRGPILCFVGPPGVGKTSIGRSIAATLGREFHRISLGGVGNPADIRGHRRTYVGAMPGRIIQAIRTVGVNNPVLLLDEIDKMGFSNCGDPGADLLEVLDPEQNKHFEDHYLNMPFDLSQVIFLATANVSRTIPAALLDRMEVIPVPGYSLEDKVNIALKHLLPKQIDLHGLTPDVIEMSPEIIRNIIIGYTSESGVRSLERKIEAICRSIAMMSVEQKTTSNSEQIFKVDDSFLEKILGMPIHVDDELWTKINVPGISIGLGVDGYGLGCLMVIEANKIAPGCGHLDLTGQLGLVLKESAKLAFNWLRTAAHKYYLVESGRDLLTETDVHIHLPAGSISKDGPSAGIAIATALVSLFSEVPVSPDIALTGEITLLGDVLPVGGVKQKVLAAYRAGLKRIIMPRKCEHYLTDLPENVFTDLTIIPVGNMDDVIQAAFDGQIPLKQVPASLCSKL